MAGTFTARKGLDELVAAMIAPKVQRAVTGVATLAKSPGYAPPTKTWVSKGDERVRPEHVKTEAAERNRSLPANLRFVVTTDSWEVKHRGKPREQLAIVPRDPKLSIGTRINCRCRSVTKADGVRKTIETRPVRVRGTHVTGEVVCTHPLAAGAEYGEGIDQGTRFLGRAVRDFAARRKL